MDTAYEALGIAASTGRYVISGPQWLRASTDLASWSRPSFSGGVLTNATATCGRIVWTGTRFVAACGTGAVLTSGDGAQWSLAQAGGMTQAWNDVAWTGSQLVVVGKGGAIATSPDGTAWTAADSPVTSDLASVAFSGTGLVAVGSGGAAIASADGARWTAGRTGTTANLRGMTWANDRFVAVGDSGAILVSTDGGASWSSMALSVPFSGSFGGVAAQAGRLVIVGDNGTIVALE